MKKALCDLCWSTTLTQLQMSQISRVCLWLIAVQKDQISAVWEYACTKAAFKSYLYRAHLWLTGVHYHQGLHFPTLSFPSAMFQLYVPFYSMHHPHTHTNTNKNPKKTHTHMVWLETYKWCHINSTTPVHTLCCLLPQNSDSLCESSSSFLPGRSGFSVSASQVNNDALIPTTSPHFTLPSMSGMPFRPWSVKGFNRWMASFHTEKESNCTQKHSN